ncbi:hypothetical protein MKW94_008345 [Papaver nudicaule]|uniref:Uncharacterized protein n=1 Tax=Papaver nudicaule TaxID=74823 RepID=A0AA41S9T3_PAPNU|nr:hypothetical protein [Papaver nudicaule]
MGVCICSRGLLFVTPSPSIQRSSSSSSSSTNSRSALLIPSMATQKLSFVTSPAVTAAAASKKVFVVKAGKTTTAGSRIKLLTRVEQLRLLTKAEKAGLLSTAERAGLSLSTIERLGLLSKAEELGVLSAATDPGTPVTLFNLSLGLLVLGPVCAYLVPEDYPWEIVLQVLVALVSVLGGSAAFAASNFVSNLQKST